MEFWCKPGDILLYGKPPTLSTKLIEVGEELEDGTQEKEYYHVAIALNQFDKIEAQGKNVGIASIDYGRFDVYRPPIPAYQIKQGLGETRKLVGEPYDWWLIIDEAPARPDAQLNSSTGIIHPVERATREDMFDASRFLFCKGTVGAFEEVAEPDPEAIYLAVKDYRVRR